MNKDIIPDIIDFWLADSRTDPERAAGRRDWWYKDRKSTRLNSSHW